MGPAHEEQIDEQTAAAAAESLREVEVDASSDAPTPEPHGSDLGSWSIDRLRVLANALGVPDRATIVDRDELLAAIRRCP